jgi:hypothetical protein
MRSRSAHKSTLRLHISTVTAGLSLAMLDGTNLLGNAVLRSSTNLSIVRIAHILCVLDATNTLAVYHVLRSEIAAPRKKKSRKTSKY